MVENDEIAVTSRLNKQTCNTTASYSCNLHEQTAIFLLRTVQICAVHIQAVQHCTTPKPSFPPVCDFIINHKRIHSFIHSHTWNHDHHNAVSVRQEARGSNRQLRGPIPITNCNHMDSCTNPFHTDKYALILASLQPPHIYRKSSYLHLGCVSKTAGGNG
ncbi:hypothetical protein K503DRAFT_312647 [Rhizopogon vinicolor AM-OR11-026]|uniref:Uncharacterized protein n=1 Tax=Rhizopogon vinicolor AM-OR11-026 TaxID=1314800 RepID=A0A1B7MUQ1_9AGAM|nr:hypothetical protein K503DRAFT_312647 [Rhizopogon vinicolor AM-OR11-026]